MTFSAHFIGGPEHGRTRVLAGDPPQRVSFPQFSPGETAEDGGMWVGIAEARYRRFDDRSSRSVAVYLSEDIQEPS